jgi:phosphoadenosine phosphosulfate reductase
MPLIKDGHRTEDVWVRIADEASLPDSAPVIVSLDRWSREREALVSRNGPVGVSLRSDQSPVAIAADLDRLGAVALEFPVFRDGRPFSYARLLRDRFGYMGEIRAFGHILRDQFLYLDRCGVNAVEVKDDKLAAEWERAMDEFSVWYQPASDARRPVQALRRKSRRGGGEGGGEGSTRAAAEARVRRFSHDYGHLSAPRLLDAMIREEFLGRIALVSSFGSESAIILHMISGIEPELPVIFLDTHKLFGETLRYRDLLVDSLGLRDVRSVQPDPVRVRQMDPDGLLWQQNPDACCNLRKVAPLGTALGDFDAWITGRKRYQGERRAVLPVIEASGGRVKINPLASWTREIVDEYFVEHGLPRHPLEAEGYLSVGCIPCTDRVAAGEGTRAGRWRGVEKTECGIHEGPASQSLTSSGL